MKKLIRKWLGIVAPPPFPIHLISEAEGRIEKKVEEWFKSYWAVECSVCHKVILAHYGGTYKNWRGQVFCSHDCIDEARVNPETKE